MKYAPKASEQYETLSVVPEVLNFKTNMKVMFSLLAMPTSEIPDFLKTLSEPRTTLTLTFFDDLALPNGDSFAPHYYLNKDLGAVYYASDRIKFLALNPSQQPHILINKNAHQLAKFQSPFPWRSHLRNIAFLRLLRLGFLLSHGACVKSPEGQGCLLIAPPDTGKTTTAVKLVVENDWKIVSEDLVVLRSIAFSCPLTATYIGNKYLISRGRQLGILHPHDAMRFYVDKPLKFLYWKCGLSRHFARTQMPFHDLTFSETIRILEAASQRKAEHLFELKTPVSHVFFLKRKNGLSTHLERIGTDEGARLFLGINRLEFNYYRDPFIIGNSFIDPTLKTAALMRMEREHINDFLRDKDLYVIRCSNSLGFVEIIEKVV